MMAKGLRKLSVHSQPSYRPLDSRHTERVAISCPLSYCGEISTHPHVGKGLTKDLSVAGCRVVSEVPVTRGTLLTLDISLLDGDRSLRLKSAHVIWVSGCQFSVRFLDVRPEQRKRLQSFIWKRISQNSVSDRRTRFRLV
jgi:c-di-GMP-binding flagellar brake protein YcgR